MLVPEKVSLSDFVTRRLHPTKVSLAYLRHELAHHTNGPATSIDRNELASLIATIELFVEDYEKLVTREPRTTAVAAPVDRTAYVSDAR